MDQPLTNPFSYLGTGHTSHTIGTFRGRFHIKEVNKMNKKEQQIISGIYTRLDELEDRIKVLENKYRAQTKVVLHMMQEEDKTT